MVLVSGGGKMAGQRAKAAGGKPRRRSGAAAGTTKLAGAARVSPAPDVPVTARDRGGPGVLSAMLLTSLLGDRQQPPGAGLALDAGSRGQPDLGQYLSVIGAQDVDLLVCPA